LYDDAKECTFKPTLHARTGGKGGGGKRGGEEKKDDDEAKRDKDDAAKDRDAFGFLDRQVTLPPRLFIGVARPPAHPTLCYL